MTKKEEIKMGLLCGVTAYVIDLSARVGYSFIQKAKHKRELDKFKNDESYRESVRSESFYKFLQLKHECNIDE